MALNVSAARSVFQNELDKLMVEELTSGFMEANAGDVIYTGGNEIKIPSIVDLKTTQGQTDIRQVELHSHIRL